MWRERSRAAVRARCVVLCCVVLVCLQVEAKITSVHEYMRYRQLPRELRRRIHDYYKSAWYARMRTRVHASTREQVHTRAVGHAAQVAAPGVR